MNKLLERSAFYKVSEIRSASKFMVYDQNCNLVDFPFAATSTISQNCVGRETIVPAR